MVFRKSNEDMEAVPKKKDLCTTFCEHISHPGTSFSSSRGAMFDSRKSDRIGERGW